MKIKITESQYKLIKEINSKVGYYRAVIEFLGEDIIFEPKGYYESFDDDGNPQFINGDVMAISNTPEIAASKSIGGALLGIWSMLMHHGGEKNNKKIYIYLINQKPDKDLSHIRMGDFEYLKEVRYKKAVNGNYVGYFIIDNKFNQYAENFYNRINSEPWDEFTDEEIDMYDEFEIFLEDININDLNK